MLLFGWLARFWAVPLAVYAAEQAERAPRARAEEKAAREYEEARRAMYRARAQRRPPA